MNLKLKHKKLYALVVTLCLVLSIAVLFTACRNKNKDGDDAQTPSYTETAECGVYYYDVPDGEILLTLSGGNKFTLTGPSENKTGSYTLSDDGKLVLDYARDEDGTTEGSLSGTTITLQRNGSNVPFIKKVNYTVTFNVNGGSTVTSATVVNGKTATKPADPTRDGYAFLGWYADGAFKTVYDFASTIVTNDVTLHAKWVPDQVGVGKYTIDFDLGYDGAPKYDAITTISGHAYNVPTPTRAGYTFGGWWISMYEDGAKLSYQYSETDTTFDSDTTLYAVWNQTSGNKLAAPMASVNKNTIKWNPISGATVYTVTITDPAGVTVLNETTGATSVNYNFADKVAGDYVISVVAVAANTANNSDATVRYIANKALAKVSQFQVIDKILIFNPVSGATSYYITVDCGNDSHIHTNFDNGSSTSFSLVNCPMQEGGIKITVTAKASGYANSVSETYVYNRVLDAIDAVVYDTQKDAFVWNAVSAATSYVVTVKVGDNTYVIDNGANTYFSTAGYTGNISVSVKPVNEGYNSPAATAATCTKVSPAIPTNVNVNGMTVTWNAAEGAVTYEIKIGNVIRSVNGTSYDLTAEELTAGKTYDISVKSINGAESSAYTEAITFGYKVMNTALTYKNNTVYWIPAIGVSNYEVKVNGVVVASNVTGNSKTIELTREGINTIEVRFTDGEGSAWAKVDVIAHAINYYPRNNTAVITKYYAVGDTIAHPTGLTYDGFDFSNWYTSPSGAAGNGKYYADGAIFNEYGSIALFADWTPKTYNVTLETEGYGISNIENASTAPATYTKDYTLPVPKVENAESKIFGGWYTQPAGTGDKLTDENGNSVGSYAWTRDTVAYPYFRVILSYVPQADGTYGVKRGPDFDSVTEVVIPTHYNGVKVTTIVENAFASRKSIKIVNIPDTIEIVGVGAFSGTLNLEKINVYSVEGNHTRYYSSDNGALLHYDTGNVYLEVVPRAMSGVYEMSDEVQYITSRAFQYSQLEKVIVGKGVVSVAKYAFYICTNITAVEFAEGRTSPVNFEDESFHQCNYITRIKLPKSFNMANESIAVTLNRLKRLNTIEVEAGNTTYAAVDGMLTSANRQTLLYAPIALQITDGQFTVPAGIRAIANGAVANRLGFVNIVIPASVTEIGSDAFLNCVDVTAVTFKGNRANDLKIGARAFAGLTSLTTVIFEGTENVATYDGEITIGEDAFAVASGATPTLSNLKFMSGVIVDTIGESAFANQTKLPTIVYEDGAVVKNYASNAFAGCTMFAEIKIPANTVKIASNAFKNCTKAAKIVVEEGTSELIIETGAFTGCKAVISVDLPKNVTSFNGAAFDGCLALASINIDPENPNYRSENGVVYNATKTTLIFYPKALVLAEIKNEQDEVIKAAGVVNNLASTLTEISASVFASNADLKAVVIPASVSKIAEKAFYSCTGLTSVTFATEGTVATSLSIGTSAFEKCTKLTEGANGISLPAYTTSIGTSAFSGCTAMTTLTIPSNAALTTIGDSAFKGIKITSLTIPSNITTIGNTAFGSTSITSLTIPTTVTKIEAGAFSKCTSLASVTITPAADGQTVANLELGDLTSTTGVFDGCTKLTSVNLGNRVSLIGNRTFYGCNNTAFTSIDLGNKVTKIGASAFYNVRLASITIPTSVTEIGASAFGGTTTYAKLTSINFEKGGTSPLTIGASVFANQKSVTAIELPARLTEIYTTTTSNDMNTIDVASRFSGMTGLKTITVETLANYNAKFSAKEGVLYENDANGTPVTLLFCPAANAGTNKAITIPKTVTYIHRGAFISITGLTTINFEEYDSSDANYAKPILIVGNYANVTKAPTASSATVFGGNTSNTITEINFPAHLGTLGPAAVGTTKSNITLTFSDKSEGVQLAPYALTAAKFETIQLYNVSEIGKGAFASCTAATSIDFTTTSAMTVIPTELFNGCTALTSYTVPKSIETIETKAFTGCTNLATINFAADGNLKTIGTSAFEKCTKISTVAIPASVVIIDSSAFRYCSGITSLTFAEGSKLEQIKTTAFDSCTGLTTVDLSNCTSLWTLGGETTSISGQPTMGNGVFKGCTNLESVNVATLENLTHIGANTFEKTALTSFVFPKNISEVGTEIFKYCEDLTEVTLSKEFKPDMFSKVSLVNNTYQGSFMFLGCTALETIKLDPENVYFMLDEFGALYDAAMTTVYLFPTAADTTIEKNGETVAYTVPASVKTIADYAFAFYNGESITLPAGLETIGHYAFYLNKFTTIDIPATVKTIGTAALSVDNATSNANSKKYYTVYESQLTSVNFAAGSQLESIGDYAFYMAGALTSINLPDSVSTFGQYVFYDCASLTKITIPASLKEIPRSTFQYCNGLTEINLQEGLEVIGSSAFALNNEAMDASKYGTVSIIIPSTVTDIGGAAFDYNALIGSITFAKGSKIKSIGASIGGTGATSGYTFRGTYITSITFPATIENLGSNILYTPASVKNGISQIKTVVFEGAEFKTLPTNFFRECKNLISVTLPEGIEAIGNSAFSGTAITSITIPASVTSIGTGAFMNCANLETVIFAEGSQLTEIGISISDAAVEESATNVFKGTTSLTSITLPDSVKVIGGYAFYESAISNLTLPTSLEVIGDYAFAESQVSSINLPASVKIVGDHAFENCDNIVTITLLGNISYIGDSAFYDCDALEEATPSFGLEYLGGLAFAYCEKLTVAYIPATVSQLGGNPYVGCSNATLDLDEDNVTFTTIDGALYDSYGTTLYFYPASNLTETVVFPSTVTTIGAGAFAGAQMKHVVYPARFETIPASMFAGCDKLESITIENGIISIGDHAFDGCVSLISVVIPNSVTYVGNYAFANCTSLTSPSFEDKTGSDYYELGTHIFDGCTSLTTVVLPNAWRITVEDAKACGIDSGDRMNPGPTVQQLEGNIPSYMFANTGIVNAVLPARVTMLCTKGVFMNCASLTSVTFGVTQLLHAENKLGADYFAGCVSLPADFKPPYKTGGVGGGGIIIK